MAHMTPSELGPDEVSTTFEYKGKKFKCGEGIRNLGVGGIARLLSLSVGFWARRPVVAVFV